ncbi:MAG: hypothetical protein LBS19_04340 [Clostridiales bacterium]|jgi:hypothetical protein|nr:hypothetical protein [Clostridiales bacterium]
MDVFKVQVSSQRKIPITQENFTRETGEKPPYVASNDSGGKSFFAVCPECENPIQIIGIYKNTPESGTTPYGRHYPKSVPKLAEYNHPDYLDCSYSNPKWKKGSLKRHHGSRVAQNTLRVLREQFDRVIYCLSKDVDMYISYNTAEAMLRGYIANEGWLYRNATMNNLPWAFGEAESALPLFGRKIVRGSDLHHSLSENCPEVEFVDADKYVKVTSKQGEYIRLYYVLTNHRKEVTGEHLNESIDLWVYRGSAPDIETVYHKTIQIRTEYFFNLINTSPEKSVRNEKYLEIAARLIPQT